MPEGVILYSGTWIDTGSSERVRDDDLEVSIGFKSSKR